MDFSSRLLSWYHNNQRPLPWRNSSDPYMVWISEIILQQTRMDQGIVYFKRFINHFPTVHDLAKAHEDSILRVWQGLGYYTRARNLHAAAKEIVENRQGVFPKNYADWIKLKGVGSYTAAAISSIAFGEFVPALDGNAYRVLSRIFAIDDCIDTSAGKKIYWNIAEGLMTGNEPGSFNQAMMDFGSLVCKPANPACRVCMYQRECLANLKNTVSKYPVRKPKKVASLRYFNYFYFLFTGDLGQSVFYIRQRIDNDIWKGLFELPMLETSKFADEIEIVNHRWWTNIFPDSDGFTFVHTPINIEHKLTHQTIKATLYIVLTDPSISNRLDDLFLQSNQKEFEKKAKPRLIERLLEKSRSGNHFLM
jgi:A/G-specific adenine glycosylase